MRNNSRAVCYAGCNNSRAVCYAGCNIRVTARNNSRANFYVEKKRKEKRREEKNRR